MNILLIHNYYIERGGEDSVYEFESAALKSAGHTVFSYYVSNRDTQVTGILRKIAIFFRMLHNRKVYEDIKTIVRNNSISIVHVHNVFPLITPKIYRILHKLQVRVVQTVHNYRFICPNGQMYRDNQNCDLCSGGAFYNCIRFRCYKSSYLYSFLYMYLLYRYSNDFKTCIDRYIVLNSYMQNLLIRNGFDKSKIVVKANGTDGSVVRENTDDYYLFIGRMTREKGALFLAEYCVRHPHIQCHFAGTGAEYTAISQFSLQYPNIIVHGFVDGVQKEALISHAKAVIIPSLWNENYPVVIAESFRHGVPVIASDSGGLPYIVKNNETGLIFKTGDYLSLSDALKKMDESDVRTVLSDNAIAYYLKNMEAKANISKLIEIYNSLPL